MKNARSNSIVHHLIATGPFEVEQIFGDLPRVVADGLVRTLDEVSEAYRYDADSQNAYFFEREGSVVDIWSWNDVRSYAEYGDLVARLVQLDERLSDRLANQVYSTATGRKAGVLQSASQDKC